MRRFRLKSGSLWALLACATVNAVLFSELAAGEWPKWFGGARSKASGDQQHPHNPAGVASSSRASNSSSEARDARGDSVGNERVRSLFNTDPVDEMRQFGDSPGFSGGSRDAREQPTSGRRAVQPAVYEEGSGSPRTARQKIVQTQAEFGRSPTPPPTLPSIGDGQPLKLIEFRSVPLVDAMQTFADQAGINIVASPDASKIEISVYLKNVTAKQALDAITKAHGLYYKVDDASRIVRISTTKEYRQTLADFQDEQTEVFTLLYPNPYVVALAIRNTFGDRVRLGMGDMQSDQDQFQDLTQRLQRFDLIESRNQGLGTFQNNQNGGGQNGLNNQLGIGGRGNQLGGIGGRGNQFSSSGQFGNQSGGQFGGGFGNQFGGGQQTNPANDMDRKPLENLSPEEIFAIEQARQNGTASESLSGLLERNRASIYVSVIRRNNQLVVRTGDELMMCQIKDLVLKLDVPTPLVLLEVKVLRVDLFDGFHSVFDYQLTDGSKNAGTFSQGDFLGIPAKSAANIAVAGSTFGAGSPGLAASAGDLTFQYVNESFRARMQLLENKNRVTVVTSPILLTANNEVSRIFVGDTVPVTTSSNSASVTQPNGGNNGGNGAVTSNAPTTELQDIGQALLITPNINADRTVTLRIAQEQSELRLNGGKILVPTVVTQTNLLGVASNSVTFTNQTIDTVQRRQITGTIVAKDGLAVAIGGLISESAQDNRDEVPVLGKVPVLGFFFRRQGSGRGRTELIVMVRPYVFNTPSESAALSQQLIPELSIHPKAMDPSGTLNTFLPHEVIRPNPPTNECENIFRFHSVEPKSY